METEIIQIDPIVPKTPKVHGDTNEETRKARAQLNIVEEDENVTSEPYCARTQDPKSCQILNWIGHFFVVLFDLMSWMFAFLLLGMEGFLTCLSFWLAWEGPKDCQLPSVKNLTPSCIVLSVIVWSWAFLLLVIFAVSCVATEWRKHLKETKEYLALLKC